MKFNLRKDRLSLFGIHALFLFIVPAGLSGQYKGSVEEYVRLSQGLPAEKVFLHIDRPSYIQGDTIWFKAYSWYGYDQIPDTISSVLYVDLLNHEGKVNQKRKLLIQNGTSNGDFILDTIISPGIYTLRAYTRRMQNLNTGDPFYQSVTIRSSRQSFQVECNPVIIKQTGNDSLQVSFRFFEMDQAGDLKNSFIHKVKFSLKIGEQILQTGDVQVANTKEHVFKYRLSGIGKNDTMAIFGLSINEKDLNFEKQFRIPLHESIDLQFFPEGGNMVTGLESRVAFKATGKDGLGLEVKGVIKDGDGKDVSSFESFHKGMGAFLLNPEAKQEYFAHLIYNNHKYIVPLPPSLEEGCIMYVSYTESNSNPKLTIRYSPSKSKARKYVAGSAYGKIRFVAQIKTTPDSCRLWISPDLLPEGISRLTILDENFKPECERLLYVDKNERFKITIKPDSSSYGRRSKVTLSIITTDLNGVPVQTNLSLAVVDKEQILNNYGRSGIREYKLLESELKGQIEDAGYYFKNDSCTNYEALDLLLLTQGYRKFLPDNTNTDELKFQPEKNFGVSGKIKFNGSKSLEKKYNYRDINLSLLCRSEQIYLDQSNADSLGQFAFKIPLVYGLTSNFLQATTFKGKPFKGNIYLDDTIPFPQFPQPQPEQFNLTSPAIEYIRQLQAVKKSEISKNPVYGAMSVTLREVVVTAKAKNWYKNFDKAAVKIANLDSLDPRGNKYKTLNELLVKEFGAREIFVQSLGLKTTLLPCVSSGRDYYFPIYVINGRTYFNGVEDGEESYHAAFRGISAFKVREIKRLLVLPPNSEISMHYADFRLLQDIKQSLVVIETYSNSTYRGDPLGITTFILEGLDAPRKFYSPGYDGPERKSPVYDGRATLYWDPSIRTDINGEAKIEFFTNDRQTGLEVIVNGIESGNGYPGGSKFLINSAFLGK
jgi:hypothetical protein